ncbi:uncharacterized protein N7511_005110 [Penicillium nucicola]|uniref:uncharacterized protein n=1 Tax=Penicillium nucicola TaxID=1850975 RepID=UPI0025457F81|nr:uncharacterized protein N7511_005110 [Penicillium nucicola]KAJ5761728.1 hypothetical protein N7511_005110 [Penicillium nucicola]
MKASIISIISLAVAVAALPPSEVNHKRGEIVSIAKAGDQCQEGTVSCCTPDGNDEDPSSFLSLLKKFKLLDLNVVCSPVEVLSHINIDILGKVDEKNENVQCNHSLACCTGTQCNAISAK